MAQNMLIHLRIPITARYQISCSGGTNSRGSEVAKLTAHTRNQRGSRRCRGAITLELLIMLPVWLIVMLAIVQFGLLIGNRQQVALASRVGAEEASRTIGLAGTTNGDPVPANVINVVEQQLLSSGINRCKITLEHNLRPAPPAPPTILTSGSCTCPTVDNPLPPNREYVRVTVYVPATELTPNVLSIFGFDISTRFVRNATTFRHEL
jgi:Flp pilus assembly protein TadG